MGGGGGQKRFASRKAKENSCKEERKGKYLKVSQKFPAQADGRKKFEQAENPPPPPTHTHTHTHTFIIYLFLVNKYRMSGRVVLVLVLHMPATCMYNIACVSPA